MAAFAFKISLVVVAANVVGIGILASARRRSARLDRYRGVSGHLPGDTG